MEVSIPFVRWNILERITDTFDVTVRSIIISIDQAHVFNRISFCSVFIYFCLINLCFFGLNMNLGAYTIARLAKTLTELTLLVHQMKKHYPSHAWLRPGIWFSLNRSKDILIKSL